ncbi:COP9 signalosome complex subunit 7 [Euphorbia peplus]|nr:COP9 signalosome complex subunit 7 [Euphorbia peplus]
MEIEEVESQVIHDFVEQASSLPASSLGRLILEATCQPSLFSFSEIQSPPGIAATLPQLIPDQVLKLKQLTLLTLAETNKVLCYDELLKELEVSNVRELEDFLINECMYKAIVKGKLNQLRRCFEVQFAAGRDPIEGKLELMIETVEKWQATSENMLSLIQEKIAWAQMMHQKDDSHQKEVDDRIKTAKKGLNSEKPYQRERSNMWPRGNLSLDHDGTVLQPEDPIRSKRRRSPNFSR